jgi:hypothetical protein
MKVVSGWTRVEMRTLFCGEDARDFELVYLRGDVPDPKAGDGS